LLRSWKDYLCCLPIGDDPDDGTGTDFVDAEDVAAILQGGSVESPHVVVNVAEVAEPKPVEKLLNGLIGSLYRQFGLAVDDDFTKFDYG